MQEVESEVQCWCQWHIAPHPPSLPIGDSWRLAGLTELREQDSNLRPRGYEPRELPGCSIPRYFEQKTENTKVLGTGFNFSSQRNCLVEIAT